ncbi:MAG: hypothetical protein K0S45_3773 [Nitrospira sp.]|jgi:hypothetical protein|nr:hypothetical protein [Nitrospira sp.]
MDSHSYCQPCFVCLGSPASLEDEMRLERLMGSWDPCNQRIYTTGLCARCGQEGRVAYYAVAQ